MAEFYQDKTEDVIKKDVHEAFKKNDTLWVRDDQEFLQSARKVIEKYVGEIKNSKENFWPWALQEFTQLKTQLLQEEKKLSGWKALTNNKALVQDLANRIDNAENSVVNKLQLNRSTREVHKALETSEKKYFERLPSGALMCTKETNPPKIHEVLGALFKNKNDVYKIDYTWCTNTNIKQRMMNETGTGSCYITYDETTRTYLLRDKKWKTLPQRALIREWVTLTPDAVIKFQWEQIKKDQENTETEKMKQASTIGNVTMEKIRQDPRWKEVMETVWNGKLKQQLESATNASTYKEFLEKSEKRLDEIVISAKKQWRELHSKPFSKSRRSNGGMMEAHFVSWSAEKDMIFLDKEDNKLSSELRDILDGHETEYMQFLTTRIQKKWNQYDFLTKKESVIKTDPSKEKEGAGIDKIKMWNIIYGLESFKKLVENLKQAEWDSRDDDDREFVAILKHIKNSLYTLEQHPWISREDLQAKIFAPLQKKREAYRTWAGQWKNDLSKEFAILASGKDEKAIQGVIRKFWEQTTVWWNTHTSFLKEDIDDKLDIEWEVFDQFYANINTKLDVSIPANQALLQQLYLAEDATSNNNNSIKTILRKNALLPAKGKLNEKKVDDACKKIKESIAQTKKAMDQNKPTKDTIRQSMQKEKTSLMVKSNKTEDDIARLQTLEVYEQNPSLRDEMLDGEVQKIASEIMGYAQLQDSIRWTLTPLFVKKAWWSDSALYDDIVWAKWLLDFSDENAAMVWEIMKSLVEEIAIMAVSAALVASGAGAWAWVALLASRVGRWGMKISKVEKIVKAIKNSKKFTKLLEVAKKSKLLHNNVTRKITSYSETLARASKQWLVHTIIWTTYRGEWDKKFNEHLVYLLQNVWMYSVLWIVWKSAETGRIAKWFTNAKGEINLSKVKVASYFFEEIGMNPTDYVTSLAFSDEPMSKQDVVNNIAMWMVFELIPWIHNVVMWKKIWKVNNETLPIQDVQSLLWDLSIKEANMYWADASLESMMKERDRLNWRASKETNSSKKKILDDVVRKLDERIASKQEISPASKKIKNQVERKSYNDRAIVQGQYAWELLQWIAIARNVNKNLLPESVNVLLDKRRKPTQSQIESVQKDIGMDISEIDGVFWPKTLKKFEAYITSIKDVKENKEGNKKWKNKLEEVNKKQQSLWDESGSNEVSEHKKDDVKWNENPFDGEKQSDMIVQEVFKEAPTNETIAKSRVEQLGGWLWKNAVWPSMAFIKDAVTWLKNIEIKFPSLKNQIAKISKKLESMRIKRSVDNIQAMQNKPLQAKMIFIEKFDLSKTSDRELIALYKLSWGQWDPHDWAVVSLKDGTNTNTWTLISNIKDNVVSLRKQLLDELRHIKHNFKKTPELKLSNQEVELQLKDGEKYRLSLWQDTHYVIYKDFSWKIIFDFLWNQEIKKLEPWKEYKVGRNHTELTGSIDKKSVSREHMSIKVNEKGDVLISDLNSTNGTVVKKIEYPNNRNKQWAGLHKDVQDRRPLDTKSFNVSFTPKDGWNFFNRWSRKYESYTGDVWSIKNKELLPKVVETDYKIFIHPKPEFFNNAFDRVMVALKNEPNIEGKLLKDWAINNPKQPQILLYIKWDRTEVERIMALLHTQLKDIEDVASYPRRRTNKWDYVSDDNAPSFLAPYKKGANDGDAQGLIWYGQWEGQLKSKIAETGKASHYLTWENNAFIRPETIQWNKKVNKVVDYSPQDKQLLTNIYNNEPLLGKIDNAKRTHRTTYDILQKILWTNIIWSNSERGVQFWWWLWSWYGDVVLIMKDQVMNVWTAPTSAEWARSLENPRMHYFWQNKESSWLSWKEYQQKIDFARNLWPGAQKQVPYLSIWGKNVNRNNSLSNQVGIENVQAVMLPAHLKQQTNYKNIVMELKQKGIDVIEASTQWDILEYTWTSIIDAFTRNRKDNNKEIKDALQKKYPKIQNEEMRVKQFLIDTDRLDPRYKDRSLLEIRDVYYNDFAKKNWLSRWWGMEGLYWQYENYASHANYNIEEKAYFGYLLYLKNNPNSSGQILSQFDLLWRKIVHEDLDHTRLWQARKRA